MFSKLLHKLILVLFTLNLFMETAHAMNKSGSGNEELDEKTWLLKHKVRQEDEEFERIREPVERREGLRNAQFEELKEYNLIVLKLKKGNPTLRKIDQVFFDVAMIPRKGVQCCGPTQRNVWEWLAGVVQCGAISVALTGVDNDVFGGLLNYPVNGLDSYLILAVSILINGDVALLQGRELLEKILEKRRSQFLTTNDDIDDFARENPVLVAVVNDNVTQSPERDVLENLVPVTLEAEDEGPDTDISDIRSKPIIIFGKTNAHKILEGLLVPTAFFAGLLPTSVFIYAERFFPAFAAPLSVPVIYFFGEPYYDVASSALEKWYARKLYTKNTYVKRKRYEILFLIENLEDYLKVSRQTRQYLWKQLTSRTNYFGKRDDGNQVFEEEPPIEKDDLVWLLGLLLKKNELEGAIPRSSELELSVREEVTDRGGAFIASVNLLPGYMMDAEAISRALSLFLSDKTLTNQIGFGVAVPLASRLLIEKSMMDDSLQRWSYFFSDDPRGYTGLRRATKIKSALFAIFNTLCVLTLANALFSGYDATTKWYFFAATALRFFLIFDSMATAKYKKITTAATMKPRKKPTPLFMDAQIRHFLQEAKEHVLFKFTDDTIDAIYKAVELEKNKDYEESEEDADGRDNNKGKEERDGKNKKDN